MKKLIYEHFYFAADQSDFSVKTELYSFCVYSNIIYFHEEKQNFLFRVNDLFLVLFSFDQENVYFMTKNRI